MPAGRRPANRPASTAGQGPAFTPARQARFLAAIEAEPRLSVRGAATKVGVKRHQVRALMDSDPDFFDAYHAARGSRRDKIRDEIWERAFDREDQSSARLLSKLADAECPEFNPLHRVSVEGPSGGAVQVEHRGVSLDDIVAVARATGVRPEDGDA